MRTLYTDGTKISHRRFPGAVKVRARTYDEGLAAYARGEYLEVRPPKPKKKPKICREPLDEMQRDYLADVAHTLAYRAHYEVWQYDG